MSKIALKIFIKLYEIKYINFILSAGTYSINDFNAEFTLAVLQWRQGWETPQKRLKTGHSKTVHIYGL